MVKKLDSYSMYAMTDRQTLVKENVKTFAIMKNSINIQNPTLLTMKQVLATV